MTDRTQLYTYRGHQQPDTRSVMSNDIADGHHGRMRRHKQQQTAVFMVPSWATVAQVLPFCQRS